VSAPGDWPPRRAGDRQGRLSRLIVWAAVLVLLAAAAVCVVLVWRLLQPPALRVCCPVPVVSVPPLVLASGGVR